MSPSSIAVPPKRPQLLLRHISDNLEVPFDDGGTNRDSTVRLAPGLPVVPATPWPCRSSYDCPMPQEHASRAPRDNRSTTVSLRKLHAFFREFLPW